MARTFKKIYDEEHFICPKCGGTLEVDDIIDTDMSWEEDSDYIEYGYGHCTKCGEEYDINVAYKFAYYLVEDK